MSSGARSRSSTRRSAVLHMSEGFRPADLPRSCPLHPPCTRLQPSDVHQRIPTFLGSVEDVEELESYGDVQQLGNKKYAV